MNKSPIHPLVKRDEIESGDIAFWALYVFPPREQQIAVCLFFFLLDFRS
jgi:hypothetical protein